MPHKISINCSIFSLVYFLDAENEGKLINLRKVGLIYLFETHLNSIAWSPSHCDFKVPVVPVQCFLNFRGLPAHNSRHSLIFGVHSWWSTFDAAPMPTHICEELFDKFGDLYALVPAFSKIFWHTHSWAPFNAGYWEQALLKWLKKNPFDFETLSNDTFGVLSFGRLLDASSSCSWPRPTNKTVF